MKVLVTGTTGKLGKQVINWFSQYYSDYQIVELSDLADAAVINHLFTTQQFDSVIHIAVGGTPNPKGTNTLLAAANAHWSGNQDAHRFLLVTADMFGAELLLREYHEAQGMNLLVSSCEETFASEDFPFVYSGIAQQQVASNNGTPVYAKGQEVPEWFWVDSEACALDVLFHQAEAGKAYTVGGMNAWKRSDLEYNPIVQLLQHTFSTANAR